MKKKYLLILIIALTLIFTTYKWGEQIQKKPAVIKIMQYDYSILYLPQYIAIKEGFFQEENLRVEITLAVSENALLYALNSGRADVLLTGLEFAIYKRDENLVAFSTLTKKDDIFLIAREEKAFTWNNLINKTIITGPQASRETVLLKGVLNKYDLKPNRQVTLFTNIPISLQIGAFKSGIGDYILLQEPYASQLEEDGSGKIVASLGKEAGELPGVVYLARKEYLKTNCDVIQRFTNAIYKALLCLKDKNTSEILQLIEPYYKTIDKDVLVKAIKRCRYENTWAEDPLIKKSKYEHLIKLIIKAKETPGPVPYKHLVNNQFALNALQNVSFKNNAGK